MKNRKLSSHILFLCQAGIIAALYVVLTGLSSLFGLSSGVIQVRISESLCILPLFTPAAVPGVTIGCLISNLLWGNGPWDVIFGTLASLLGVLGACCFRRAFPYLAPLPTVLANTLILPFVLKYALHLEDSIYFLAITIFAGEAIAAWALGLLLFWALKKRFPLFSTTK